MSLEQESADHYSQAIPHAPAPRGFTQADRDTIIEITRADPEYMLGLLESSMYDASVDVTDIQEARLIMAELAALCASTMAPGTAARVARFMNDKDTHEGAQ